jgi:hypothetical protein
LIGHFSAFDENGHYLVYNNCHELWDGAEPRLRANLLLPGQVVKGGFKVDLRAGIFNKDIDPAVRKFKKFSIDDGADGNYIYDAKNLESGSDRITFSINNYYEGIPGDELKNNPLLQKNRNQ